MMNFYKFNFNQTQSKNKKTSLTHDEPDRSIQPAFGYSSIQNQDDNIR